MEENAVGRTVLYAKQRRLSYHYLEYISNALPHEFARMSPSFKHLPASGIHGQVQDEWAL